MSKELVDILKQRLEEEARWVAYMKTNPEVSLAVPISNFDSYFILKVIELDEKDPIAFIHVEVHTPSMQAGGCDWVTTAQLADFRAQLSDYASGERQECCLEGFENDLNCCFRRNDPVTKDGSFLSLSFKTVRFDHEGNRSEKAITMEGAGPWANSEFSRLTHVLEEVISTMREMHPGRETLCG